MSSIHKKSKAAFLDRDGTINKNFGYVIDKKKFKFLKNAIPAIKYLKKKKFLVIVITNQSGISRGFFSNKAVIKLHNWVIKELKKKKTLIDKFYFCSYHPRFSKLSKKNNFMRKPNPGMILKAAKDFNVDLKKSFMIGDSLSDKLAAKRAGILFFKKKQNLLITVKRATYKLSK